MEQSRWAINKSSKIVRPRRGVCPTYIYIYIIYVTEVVHHALNRIIVLVKQTFHCWPVCRPVSLNVLLFCNCFSCSYSICHLAIWVFLDVFIYSLCVWSVSLLCICHQSLSSRGTKTLWNNRKYCKQRTSVTQSITLMCTSLFSCFKLKCLHGLSVGGVIHASSPWKLFNIMVNF